MKKSILILIIFMLILNMGCTRGQNELIEDNSLSVDAKDREIIDRSESISDRIVELYGIDDATTIVFNEMALIGVKLSYDEKLNKDIKATITDAVKNFDVGVETVKITQDKKIYRQIDDIMNKLITGKPYELYLDEIYNISNKIK